MIVLQVLTTSSVNLGCASFINLITIFKQTNDKGWAWKQIPVNIPAPGRLGQEGTGTLTSYRLDSRPDWAIVATYSKI